MKTIRALIIFIVVLLGGVVAYAYSGWYDVSVGSGHNAVTEWYLETLRERSIESRAATIPVPALDDPAMVRAGAIHYDDGCAGCHGKPGAEPSDSFEPAPPALARHAEEPAEAYWIIQNGIKMSAMPIKGRGHSEEEVWSIVAFLQELPNLTADEYAAMVERAKAESSHSHDNGHGHGSGNGAGAAAGGETPAETMDRFHQALASGDRDTVLALLHDNATILEGGILQTKAQYAAGHLESDMAFLSGIETEQLSRSISASDSQATASTETRFTGEYEGEPVDARIAETATLVNTDGGWRISHINWATLGSDAASDSADAETTTEQPEG